MMDATHSGAWGVGKKHPAEDLRPTPRPGTPEQTRTKDSARAMASRRLNYNPFHL